MRFSTYWGREAIERWITYLAGKRKLQLKEGDRDQKIVDSLHRNLREAQDTKPINGAQDSPCTSFPCPALDIGTKSVLQF